MLEFALNWRIQHLTTNVRLAFARDTKNYGIKRTLRDKGNPLKRFVFTSCCFFSRVTRFLVVSSFLKTLKAWFLSYNTFAMWASKHGGHCVPYNRRVIWWILLYFRHISNIGNREKWPLCRISSQEHWRYSNRVQYDRWYTAMRCSTTEREAMIRSIHARTFFVMIFISCIMTNCCIILLIGWYGNDQKPAFVYKSGA